MRKLAPGEPSFNALYAKYRGKARKRNLSFNLTKDDFRRITKQNCYYCGVPPSKTFRNPDGSGRSNGSYDYNGIDRVNNSLGYEVVNSVPCCYKCNIAKQSMSLVEFYDWIKLVHERIK